MDDFEYVDMDKILVKTGKGDEKPEKRVIDLPESIMDQIRLVSKYKGVHVSSRLFDSMGTVFTVQQGVRDPTDIM